MNFACPWMSRYLWRSYIRVQLTNRLWRPCLWRQTMPTKHLISKVLRIVGWLAQYCKRYFSNLSTTRVDDWGTESAFWFGCALKCQENQCRGRRTSANWQLGCDTKTKTEVAFSEDSSSQHNYKRVGKINTGNQSCARPLVSHPVERPIMFVPQCNSEFPCDNSSSAIREKKN